MTKKLFSNLLILSLIVQASIGLFAFPNQAKAAGTIYYIDNTITDTNVGSATPDCTNYDPAAFTCSGGSASAYKTVADVNLKAFSAGDSVLFRQGQTWRESLTVPSSGTNGNPITFGAFGTGTNPLIDGSFQINNWHETVTGNHIWATPISDPAGVVVVNGTPGIETASSTSGLIFSDDFESGNFSKWSNGAGMSISTAHAQSGTRSAQALSGGTVPYLGRNDPTVYIHFWIYVANYPADYTALVNTTSSNGKDMAVSVGPSSDHKFYIVNTGGTNVGAFTYNLNTWYEVELRATVGSGSNAVGQLRVNGTSVGTSSNGAGTGGYTTIYLNPDSDVYLDDFAVRTDTWPRDATPVYTNVNGTGKWAYDGTYNQELYVYALTTPTVLVGSGWQGIVANNKSYITLNGLAVKYWKDNGVRLIGGANHVVSNMDIEQNGSTGLLIVDQAGVANDIVQNNIVDGNKEGGLFIGGNGNQNVIVSGNKLTNNINRTSDQGDQLRIISINSGLQVYNNFILRPTPFTPPPTGNDEGIDCANTCNGADIHNNVVIGSYIDVKNGTTGAKIYNNTVYVPSTAAANTSAFYATGDSTGTILRNNIFVDLVPSSRAIYLDPGAELNTTSNYNLIYDPSGSVANINNAVYNTLANLQAAGFDVNSVSSDPLFINTSGLFNTASDFSLLSTSPAIDSGTSLGDTYKLGLNPNSVWPSSVNTLDQTLNGLGWDIGAYVYTETTPPTVSLTAPTDSTTVSGASVTLSATASDNSAVAGVQFKLDTNTNIGAEDTTSPYGVTWDSTAVLDGTHTLIAVARDTYGNYATSSAVTVTVHNATGGGGGATYPSIYQVAVSSTTPTSAIISWKTDYNTNSEVDYGISTVYGLVKTDSAATTTHIILLNNLLSATTYQFKVKSSLNGIAVTSNNSSFTTLTAGGQTITPIPLATTTGSSELPGQAGQPMNRLTTGQRLINNNGTFYLIQNGLLQGITSPGILNSYGFEFKDAAVATLGDLALPQGSLLLPDGGALVKSVQDKTVYLIVDGQRRAFVSARIFLGLGFKFSTVLLVTNPELQALPKGADISNSTSAHTDGINISYKGTVYFISNNVRHPYPSIAVYNSWNIDNDFSRVIPANAADLALPVGEVKIVRAIE